ncbi:MAG: hypothetical protein WDZ52_08475 [Pseudohongiellaceae bacterium]
MKTSPSLLCCLLIIGLSSMVSAQSELELRILNPTGFIAPGQSEEIIAEIANPMGSGITIEQISGGGHSNSGSIFQNVSYARDFMRVQMQGMARRPAERYRLVSGNYPVRPGESVQFVLSELQIPADAPIGESIGFSKLSAKLNTGTSPLPIEVYADLDALRIISYDGSGDAAQFDSMDLVNPQAGLMDAKLLAEFSYPERVFAGESFDLIVIITNQAESAIEINYPATGEMANMLSWQGEHARSYRFIPCTDECLVFGSAELEQGDSLTLRLGAFYYENEEFFSGSLILEDFMLNAFDRLGRHESMLAIADPINVTVEYDQNSALILSDSGIQPEQLQQRDLHNSGDRLVIYDPNTGLEWLQLTAGKDYTLEQMLAETRDGALFEGFSLASSAQVEQLILNHMNSMGQRLQEYALYSAFASIEPVQALVELMGNIPTVNNTLGFNGIVNDSLPESLTPDAVYTVMELSVTAADPNSGVFLRSSGERLSKHRRSLDSFLVEYTGYWMVR